ncbi:hypothetical protein LYSHEL_13070 [Lysobacter helvus]|uniref:J domain-containing protein n=2 Tax=Lysobacteraceae TaxID=32033 RepID=A0ABM7Q4W2_9GAMM|nr:MULTISPECIES: hypothetical protein [Lysobacter]BCT92283.1 hypothetical protein LYSCAS_13070 [Lysobacter caseinilyticus]BCT95436.1 hypothetical protein LYSHEL_13070 [Lysobacter helvus]
MLDALAWFGLGSGASVRDLKRAYAQRLKAARPDEDPAGFQQLRAMYEAACWMIDDDADVAVMPANQAIHAPIGAVVSPEPDASAQSIDTLHPALLAFGRADDAAGLRTWLLAQDVLWSLKHKGEAASDIATMLWEELPPFGEHAFDVLAGFFDEWQIDRGRDPVQVALLRETLIVRWYLLPEHASDLARAMIDRHLAATPRAANAWVRQLKRPFARWQVLLFSLIPGVPTRLHALLQWLGVSRIALPPEIDPRQVTFWNAAGNRTVLSEPRTLVGLSRAAAYAFATTLPFAHTMANAIAFAMNTAGIAFAYALGWFAVAMTSESRRGPAAPLVLPGLMFGLLCAASMMKGCLAG